MSISSTQLIEQYFEPKIDLIEHLIHYSQNILLVLAPQGGGKTAFADFCLDYPTPDLKKHLLEATPTLSLEEMMEDIAKGFGMSWPPNDAATHNMDVQKIWTLLVDDAQLLTLDKLEALIRLVNFRQEPKRQLHLVLLGDDRLLTLFADNRIRHLAGSYSTIIELGLPRNWQVAGDIAIDMPTSPASPESANFFKASTSSDPLEDLQDSAKLDLDEPLFESKFESKSPSHFEEALERDWLQESRKNQDFEEQDLESDSKPVFHSTSPQKSRAASYRKIWLHPVACGVYLGFIMGIGLLIWNGQEDKPRLITEQEQEQESLPLASSASPQQIPKQIVNATANSPNIYADEEPIAEEIDSAVTAPPVMHKPTAVRHTPETQPIKKNLKPEAKKSKPAQKVAVVQPAVFVKSNAKSQSQLQSIRATEKVILAKKSNHYTLQLYSSNDKQKVLLFKQQHGLDKAWVISKRYQGKTWHVLVAGDYLNKAQAQQAARRLPHSIYDAKITPWVREFAGVQKEIGAAT